MWIVDGKNAKKGPRAKLRISGEKKSSSDRKSRNSSGEALDTIYSKYFEITNTNIIYLRYIYHSNTQPNYIINCNHLSI